jgi:Winged helix DNA-binding domain
LHRARSIVTEMTRQNVLQRRLATQRLHDAGLPCAADVVRLLGCVQSQEYAHALWSLGMRTNGLNAADVQAEFDRGDFFRTHILRPTWHFVAAEDIRWVLEARPPEFKNSIRRSIASMGSIRPHWTMASP